MCKHIEMRVVAAVIQSEDKFLACRRAPHKNLAGKWEFPGGKVEADETDGEALAREILEELGVEVSIEQFLIETSQNHGESTIEMFTYLASLSAERPTRSSDHDQMKWLPLNELSQYDWAELDVPVIAKLQAIFNN